MKVKISVGIGCKTVEFSGTKALIGKGSYTRAEVKKFLRGEPLPCRWCNKNDCGYTYKLSALNSDRIIEVNPYGYTMPRTITNLAAIESWARKKVK